MQPIWQSRLLSLLFLVTTSFSFKIVINPDDSLPIDQRIVKHGYPLERYTVTSEDEYILTLYRIPHGLHEDKRSSLKSPVLLVPGMGVSPISFICMGKYRSLPYYLVDRGYDVWLVNTRACKQSQGHKKYDLDKDRRYWDYSFHELAIYDLPKIIDFIIEKTHQKPFLIGHSQGNTIMYIMLAERPEYNEKLKIGIAYGPSVVIHHVDIPFAMLFVQIVEVFEAVYAFFDLHEVFPFGRVGAEALQFLSNVICSERTYFRAFCNRFVDVIGTHVSPIIDEEAKANIIASERVRFSSRTLFHYMQIVKSARFARYNYGVKENLRRYGHKSAPLYDLSKITAPMAIFYAAKDEIITIKGALETIDMIPSVIHQAQVPNPDFNHIDFILGSNATFLVYEPTIELMRQYDEGKLKVQSTRKQGG